MSLATSPWLAVLLIVTAVSTAEARAATEFRYDRVGETRCALSQRPIKPEWSNELDQRMPEFRALWESMSPGLVEAVATLTKKRFLSPPVVRLTLCPAELLQHARPAPLQGRHDFPRGAARVRFEEHTGKFKVAD